MITSDQVISIGTITRTHGKRGEVQCITDNTLWEESEAKFLILQIDNILVPFEVEEWRYKGEESLLFSLSGIDTEDKANSLVNVKAYMLRRDITISEDDNPLLTWTDLVGYHLLANDGTSLGTIQSVDCSTANIVATTNHDQLFPLHEDLILSMNIDKREIQISLSPDFLIQ